MIEQPEAMAGANVPTMSVKLALSDEARASLEAVRVAQESARLRARKQTLETRIWFGALVGAVAVVGGFGPSLARAWRGRAPAPMSARTLRSSVATAEAPAATATAPLGGSANPEANRAALATGSTTASAPEPSPVVVAAKTGSPTPDEGCDRSLIRSAPWRLSPEACARAFDADPNDASLALAVAHAEHAHGSHAEAANWAKRALALDPNAAEAYVIIARAEAESGQQDEARQAYRRYLDLAPRGWHHAEARAALRRPTNDAR